MGPSNFSPKSSELRELVQDEEEPSTPGKLISASKLIQKQLITANEFPADPYVNGQRYVVKQKSLKKEVNDQKVT